MAQALRDAYSDIFLIKEQPTNADKTAVEGKFKSFHNASDNVAGLMAKTFFGLLALAHLKAKPGTTPSLKESETGSTEKGTAEAAVDTTIARRPGLHYNIQIHLPATKDVEVYSAIFKSLREHLFNE